MGLYLALLFTIILSEIKIVKARPEETYTIRFILSVDDHLLSPCTINFLSSINSVSVQMVLLD